MRRILTYMIAAILTLACEGSITAPSPTGGGSTDPPPVTTSVPVEVRNDRSPAIQELRIVSAFSLAERDDGFIRGWIDTIQGAGYNTVRVCGEVSDWGFRPWLPQGDGVDGAVENVRNLLKITAEYPNVFVLLVPICTIRDTRSFAEMVSFTERIADVVIEKDYKHVVFEAVNEHWHPSSRVRSDAKVLELIRILQRTNRPVGTDDNIHPGNVSYNPALRGVVDFVSVHPWRNPDPSRAEIARIVRKNGGLVVFSETTSYVTDEEIPWFSTPNCNLAGCGETRTADRKAQIRAYKEACDSVPGCVWTYHSVTGLHCQNQLRFIP